MNQREFEASTATSLANLTGRSYSLPSLAAHLLECLERRYLQLRAGRLSTIRYDYLHALYRYQESHSYEIEGRRVLGEIMGVDETGRLALALEGQLRHFDLKEIRYVL